MDTKALRQKILDLAIRGKLVPQDPNDEPASVLLERIRAEKQQMVKDGKLKPKDIKNDTVIFKGDDNLHYEKFSDGTVKCIEDEIPFELPDNWEWVRLGSICPYGDNKAIPSDSISESSWILDLEDIEKDIGLIKHYATKTERNSVSNKYAFTTGQLLYSKLRPYLNKVVIATKDGYCTTEILPLIFYGNISAKYMQIFMMSPTFLAYVNMISYGVKMPRLGTSDGKNALIAIPPINEQLRIREQFDIIIPLLCKIEKHSDTLHSNVLATKSKILDLAIRGKLVPQDPNDEPASVLLEHIRAEKEELIKQGRIKRNKKESVIFKGDDNSYYEKIGNDVTCIDNEIPFEIPDNWCWARLSQLSSQIFAGGDKPKIFSKEYTEKCTVPIYSNGIENNGLYGYTDLPRVTEKSLTISARGTIGFACVRNEPFVPIIRLLTIVPATGVYAEYIKCVFQYFLESGKGSSIPQLTVPEIKPKLIPVPPGKEQSKIVKRIDIVFSILNTLEPNSA